MVNSYEDEMEFETLFAESDEGPQHNFAPGDEVVGTVMHVGSGGIQLDIGGVDGLLDGSQIPEEKIPELGDTVRCYVLRLRGRLVEVGTRMNKAGRSQMALQTALDSGLPVDGKVLETNKGGYVIEIGGGRGFCPHAQIDLMRIEDPETLVGRAMMFKVIELRDGRDPVVSRRAVLVAERALMAEETRKQLVVGGRFRGRVTSIRDFGFFVDIGGLEGLVHVSELPYGRKRPQEVVNQGETVDVEVLRIEEGSDERNMRIGLSMKALADDPFDAAVSELGPGTVMHGTVTRVQTYGAFVEVATGVEGLLHISAFGRRINQVRNVVAEGDEILVRVKEVDSTLRRMSLAWVEKDDLDQIIDKTQTITGNSLNARVVGIARDIEQPEASEEAGSATKITNRPPPKIGTLLPVTAEKHLRFGLLVKWPGELGGPGEGLIPLQELGLNVSTELRKKFPIGATFEAVVIDVRNDGRVRLSKEAAGAHKERAEANAYMAKQQKAQQSATGEDMGSFGALLKEKLGL